MGLKNQKIDEDRAKICKNRDNVFHSLGFSSMLGFFEESRNKCSAVEIREAKAILLGVVKEKVFASSGCTKSPARGF